MMKIEEVRQEVMTRGKIVDIKNYTIYISNRVYVLCYVLMEKD